jgi:protein-tyrosine phosphatase
MKSFRIVAAAVLASLLPVSGAFAFGGANPNPGAAAPAVEAPKVKLPPVLNNVLFPENTHLIDSAANGFEIYRTSRPYQTKHFKNLCALGITEMMVLDGQGSVDADLAKKYCPQMKVVYNVAQDTKTPLDPKFLAQFDNWVQDAKATGKKIAFRCNCGCHRTGRLAAYYQMRYMGYTDTMAVDDLYKYGKYMFLYGFLKYQVRALYDYVLPRECTQKAQYCVGYKK